MHLCVKCVIGRFIHKQWSEGDRQGRDSILRGSRVGKRSKDTITTQHNMRVDRQQVIYLT